MLNKLDPIYCKHVPEELESGKIYISLEYQTAIHLCCCGCNQETVTPFDDNGWTLKEDGCKISLHPSIGNYNFPCKSHYYIKSNKIQWL